MVLNRSAYDLGCRSRSTIYQHDQRIFLTAVAVGGAIDLLRRVSPVMRDDHLTLVQELVGHVHAFIQQAARILAQVKNQPFQSALGVELVQGFRDFMSGSFGETVYVHVADARANFEFQIDAVAWDFVANHRELDGLFRAFAKNSDVDRSSLRTLQ